MVELDSNSVEKSATHLDTTVTKPEGLSGDGVKEGGEGKNGAVVNLPELTFSKEDQLSGSLATRMKKWFRECIGG